MRREPGGKPQRFRLAPLRALESALQRQIMDYLAYEQARGRVVWYCRVNGGLAQYGKYRVLNYCLHLRGREPMGKGISDLLIMLPGGRLAALEVKKPGEKPTPEQVEFLAATQAGGGIAAVVHSFEDAKAALFGPGNPSPA